MQRQKRACAFTLVELVVGIAMFSILMLALQSAVMLASKAIPDAKSAGANQLSASSVANRISAELTYALSVTELTTTAITFTVADRNGDGSPETIRYAWSGVGGDPLTRQYNGGSALSVLDDIREFAMSYDKRSMKNAATYTESAETLLYSFTGGLFSNSFTIDTTDWCGEYFVPTLPSGTAYWRITHVRYEAERDSGSLGVARVQIRTATATGLPTTTIVDQQTLLEANLSGSFGWQDAYYTSAAPLDPASGACVVIRWVNDAQACDILSKSLILPLGSVAKMVSTSNGGTSWSSTALNSLPLYVYGTSATKNADTYTYNLNSVRLVLRSGTDGAARVNTAAQIFSQPTVTGP